MRNVDVFHHELNQTDHILSTLEYINSATIIYKKTPMKNGFRCVVTSAPSLCVMVSYDLWISTVLCHISRLFKHIYQFITFLKDKFEAETTFQNSYNLVTQEGHLSHALLQDIADVNTRWYNCTIRTKTAPISCPINVANTRWKIIFSVFHKVSFNFHTDGWFKPSSNSKLFHTFFYVATLRSK